MSRPCSINMSVFSSWLDKQLIKWYFLKEKRLHCKNRLSFYTVFVRINQMNEIYTIWQFGSTVYHLNKGITSTFFFWLTSVRTGSSFTDMHVSAGFKGRCEKYIEYFLFGSSIKAFHHDIYWSINNSFWNTIAFHIDNRSYKI